jgi:hypothetical protein
LTARRLIKGWICAARAAAQRPEHHEADQAGVTLSKNPMRAFAADASVFSM